MSVPAESDSPENTGIPFSFFCSLVREISKIQPRSSKTRAKKPANYLDYPVLHMFRKWVEELRTRFSPLPPNTTAICFRMLFPEEDVRRRYDIQETRMSKLLEDCFGVDAKVFEKWSLEEASGCLGQELKIVLDRTCPHDDGFISPLTIAEADELLDELAAKSGFSHASIRSKYPKKHSRTRAEIFRTLFRRLSPEDASVLSQIILKDLRPLLYPLTEFHYTTALTKFDVAAVKMLTKEHAMDIWDPSGMFLKFYRVRSNLDEAAAFADQPSGSRSHRDLVPVVGSPVAIPKSEKGRGYAHALEFLHGSQRVWAETKYDGERAQIHVEVGADGSSHITIFSKSKRDSTLDRHAVHSVIRSALGLESTNHRREGKWLQVKQNVILDAEMVAFRGDTVDEFWRIRQLIEDTAYGIRGARRPYNTISDELESMNSDAGEGLCLGLVFFDVILLDSESLLFRPYGYRRKILETLIRPETGKAVLADRYFIDMSMDQPHKFLGKIFDDHNSACQEGLVLKAEESRYNDYRMPWVKLKKDYLPGVGDALDLVILGASWEKVRGRSLRVPPTTFTTFYIGGVETAKDRVPNCASVTFHVYFTASYGLTRDELDEVNFLIKASDPVPYSSLINSDLPFSLTVFKGLKPPPAVILRTPLLANLYGAGFTKAHQSKHYELRFPRIAKVYRPSERKWQEGADLEMVHKVALKSVGRDSVYKDVSDWANNLFGKQASPSVDCALKRKAMADMWEEGLMHAEKKSARYAHSPIRVSRSRSENTPPAEVERRPSAPVRSRLLATENNVRNPPLSQRTNLSPPATVEALCNRAAPLSPIVEHQSTKITRPSSKQEMENSDPFLDKSLVWFALSGGKSHRPCSSVATWKKQISRERRMHTLESLLLGCGWFGEGLSWVEQGVIILDECDTAGWKEDIAKRVKGIEARTRRPLIVFGCRSAEALFQLV